MAKNNKSKIKKDNIKAYKPKKAWETDLDVRNTPTIIIPYKVHLKILSIEKKVLEKYNNVEFSVLLKGHWKGIDFVIEDDLVIPKQEVSYASVNFDEIDLAKYDDYNCIVHRHPDTVPEFSYSDYNTLTRNYDVSLLLNKHKYTDATVRIPFNGNYIWIDNPELIVMADDIDIDISNIKRETHIYKPQVSYGIDINTEYKNNIRIDKTDSSNWLDDY